MRVLVTGGAGFIGSHVVEQLLARGHEVFVIDNFSSGCWSHLPSDGPAFDCDIRNASLLSSLFDEIRPHAVCHQAAQVSVSRSMRDPAYDAEVNILGLLRVLEQCARTGVQKVVFASSGGALYGDVSRPAPEFAPCKPISPYGISKWVGEQYLQCFARENASSAVALRYSNVYGPRQNAEGEAGVIAIFTNRMSAGEPTTIFGDGGHVRDFVYVGDVADANVRVIEQSFDDPFTAINVGTGRGVTINYLANQLHGLCSQYREQLGKGLPPQPEYADFRPGDLRSSLLSKHTAETLLGWKPTVTLHEGLKRTLEWVTGHGLEDNPGIQDRSQIAVANFN